MKIESEFLLNKVLSRKISDLICVHANVNSNVQLTAPVELLQTGNGYKLRLSADIEISRDEIFRMIFGSHLKGGVEKL